MDFFYKDIKFYRSLSINSKKKLIYFFFFLCFFFYNNMDIIRIKKFLFLLLLLLLWKILIELCCYFSVKNNKLKNFIRYYENIFTYIVKVLLFIQKWRNPLLLLLLYIDLFLLRIVRNLIYIFKVKYKKNLTPNKLEKIFFIYYFIINILLGPLKLIFGFFYTALRTIIEVSFSFFFLTRIIAYVFGVLIIWDLFFFLCNFLGFFVFFLLIYSFLIIINVIVKYIGRDFLFFKLHYMNNFIKTDFLINLRNNSTLIGFFILTINDYKNYLIDSKYINITSSHLKEGLDEGFYKYWEYYKRNTWFSTLNVWSEIKNRPSYYLYLNLLAWISISPIIESFIPNAITNILYIKYKVYHLKLTLPQILSEDLDFLYVFFLLRLKLLLFMIWDIDNYIGNKTCYITWDYDETLKIYSIKAVETFYDFFERDDFNVEENKEDLPFYDPENNMEFFDRLYFLIGSVPYNENPLETPVRSLLLFKIKQLIENMYSRLYECNKFVEWRRHHFHKKEEEEENRLIEDKVKNWIIVFFKESKMEWEILKKKETIFERNFRLLKEIESLVLNKK